VLSWCCMRTIWDISPPISPETPVFPGDTPYGQRWTAHIGPGCPVNVSAITLSPHVGAHADAPLHYGRDASTIGQVSLEPFLGPCRVVHVLDLIEPGPDASTNAGAGANADAEGDPDAGAETGASAGIGTRVGVGPASGSRGLITPAHLADAMGNEPPPVRVLVRTNRRVPTRWTDDFAAFDPASIVWLASLGVRLVGIDTPSVDPADSKTLESHQQLLAHDMRVLENLVLDEVEPGDYELIALPLKLMGADASPVRAVLRALQ
jgi:arylformamidase